MKALLRILGLMLPLLAGASASAQTFPTGPVKLVVPFAAGGSTDITARILAQKLSELWSQPVVVENRGGGDTIIGTEAVVQSAPDGYTVLIGASALPITAATKKLRYNVQKDLLPVTLLAKIPNVLVVHPSVPVSTVAEFVALARSKPGQLNFASAGPSTGQRLTFELLKQRLGIDVVHVPYKGGAPATQAVLAGEVQSIIVNVVEALPHIQAGRMKPLAVTTSERFPALPQVPTLSETVLPGSDVTVWQGVLVPAGTPKAIVEKLNESFRKVLADREVVERLQKLGLQIVSGTPDEFGAFIAAEIATWGDVAERANILRE